MSEFIGFTTVGGRRFVIGQLHHPQGLPVTEIIDSGDGWAAVKSGDEVLATVHQCQIASTLYHEDMTADPLPTIRPAGWR